MASDSFAPVSSAVEVKVENKTKWAMRRHGDVVASLAAGVGGQADWCILPASVVGPTLHAAAQTLLAEALTLCGRAAYRFRHNAARSRNAEPFSASSSRSFPHETSTQERDQRLECRVQWVMAQHEKHNACTQCLVQSTLTKFK